MDPLFVALGLVVGALVGMTGVGAGSLVTPALTLSGVPAPIAVGTDLVYAAASKSAGAIAHRTQRSLDLGLAGLLAVGSVPAAVLTLSVLAASAHSMRESVIGAALAIALFLTALLLLAGRERITKIAAGYEAWLAPRRRGLTIAAGALLGVLVAISSIGAGALGAALIVALHPAMPAARIAGSDIAHAVPLTFVAGLGHVWMGNVDFGLALNLLAGSVPGIVAGSLLAGRISEHLVRRVLALALLGASGRLAYTNF